MKLDKAIEAIELIVKYPQTPIGVHTLKAFRLSIEALKRIKVYHEDDPLLDGESLPGETPEWEVEHDQG